MLEFVFKPFYFWAKKRVETTCILAVKLLKGNPEDGRVFEFFAFSVVIASFLSFGEKLNLSARGDIANVLSKSDYFSSLEGASKNIFLDNYISYYQAQGGLIYLLMTVLSLFIGIFLSSLDLKSGKPDLLKQYVYRVILRYFYIWFVTFFCANIFHLNKVKIFNSSKITEYTALWLIISSIYFLFMWIDFGWKKWEGIVRSSVVSLFLVVGIYSYNQIKLLPHLKVRAAYLALSDIQFKKVNTFSQMYYLHLTQGELLEKSDSLKRSILEIAGRIGVMETDWLKAQAEIIDYCNSIKNKSPLYKREVCDQFTLLSMDAVSSFQEHQRKSNSELTPFLTTFPVEKIFKVLIF